MNVFIIQPNYFSISEVWMRRMNNMLEENICGIACYHESKMIRAPYPVFNLNGERPTRIQNIIRKINLVKIDNQILLKRNLLKFIKKCSPNVFLIQYASTATKYIEVLKALNIPIFVYVHGFDIIIDHKDNIGKNIHSNVYAEKLLEVSKIENVWFIVSSNVSKENLISFGIEDFKIKWKIFGVEKHIVKRNYNKDNLTILFLGRFVDFKGPDIVLQAFLIACENGFKGNLIMAGDGPLRMMCELICKRSAFVDRVQFTGEVSEKEAEILYSKADIFTMHSCYGLCSNGYDTFGVTVIEAMSFALPIIVGDFGGPKELIENGFDGLIIESENTLAHANAMMLLYKDRALLKKLGENAQQKAINKYSLVQEKRELYNILGLEQE